MLFAFACCLLCRNVAAQQVLAVSTETVAVPVVVISSDAAAPCIALSTGVALSSSPEPCVSWPAQALRFIYSDDCGLLFNRCVVNDTLAGADRMQELLSRRFMAVSESLDKTISFSSSTDVENLSSLLVSVNYQKSAAISSTNTDISLHLKLPRTSGKLNLIVEHVGEDLLPGENQQVQSIEQAQERLAMGQATAGSFIGLRYIIGITKAVQEHIDGGVHARVHNNTPYLMLTPFLRSSLSYSARLGKLDGRIYQQAMWDSSDWLSLTGGLYLEHPLAKGLVVASSSNILWESDSAQASVYQTISFPWVLGGRDVLTPAFQCQGETYPALRNNLYALSVAWRHRLFKKWVYGEVTPTLNYPRASAFFPAFVQWFRLDMLFGAGS